MRQELRPPPFPMAPVSGTWRRPNLVRPLDWGVPLRWAWPPYPGRTGVGKEGLGRVRPRDPRPVEIQQRGAVSVVSPLLGSRETHGNYPRTPPSVRGEAAGLPGGFEDRAWPGRLHLHPPRPPPPPATLPAVSRRRHFRQPTRPGLSPLPDHPPWGALTAQRVPPLPPPSPKWRRRPPIFSSPSSGARDPSAHMPRPYQPDLIFPCKD
jgi:hypothetical protein